MNVHHTGHALPLPLRGHPSPLLNPRHVAIVGASNRPSNAGLSFVRALRAARFGGRISAVNRAGANVEGALGATSLGNLPDPPDLAILAVPAPLVTRAAKDAAASGVRALHVFTGGFTELSDAEAAAEQDRLVRTCDEAGIALIGPNCMGLYRPRAGLAFREDQPMLDGPVGLVSQSGGVVIAATHQLAARGLGVATAISFGNGAQLGAGSWSEFLAEAGEHSVLAVYVESANEPDLAERLERAARHRPVVVCVGPSGHAATAAARRHTGAPGGPVLPQEWPDGVVAVSSIEQLITATEWHARRPLPERPPRVAVVTISGGVGVLAASSLEAAGVRLSRFTDDTRQALLDHAGRALVSIDNPVDLGARYLSRKLAAGVLTTLGADPGVDVTLFHLVWDHLVDVDRRNPGYAEGYLNLLLGHAENRDDFAVYFPPMVDDAQERSIRDRLHQAGIPVFETWDAAARTLSATRSPHRTN